ncbi:hypothetical protein GCM10007895_10510 [Paraferrimonas sedimenticola]|uniref:Uncharacterized protein n=1 Tax=Paraferrimonas sedimenticola TaxID=375674 RepID=A0AA37RUV0_9GAMM|nr:hypothetical protein GCM10007895_10510 [Paraferrimonas sedimenticola]
MMIVNLLLLALCLALINLTNVELEVIFALLGLNCGIFLFYLLRMIRQTQWDGAPSRRSAIDQANKPS